MHDEDYGLSCFKGTLGFTRHEFVNGSVFIEYNNVLIEWKPSLKRKFYLSVDDIDCEIDFTYTTYTSANMYTQVFDEVKYIFNRMNNSRGIERKCAFLSAACSTKNADLSHIYHVMASLPDVNFDGTRKRFTLEDIIELDGDIGDLLD